MINNMNVFQAGASLFEWFAENDTFSLEEDFSLIKDLIVEDPVRDKAAFICALENLEKMEMVQSSVVEGDKKVWVLCRNYKSIEQTLTLTAPVAQEMARVINAFCDSTGTESEYCDPASIQEKDISNLLFICTFFAENNKEETDEGGEIQGFSVEK